MSPLVNHGPNYSFEKQPNISLNHHKYLQQTLSQHNGTNYSGGSRIFPRGGREPSRGGVNTPNFPKNCMKSKEFGRPGGGVRPSRPP